MFSLRSRGKRPGSIDSAMSYQEVPLLAVVRSLEELDAAAYLAVNQDVRAAGMDAAGHLVHYGLGEGRKQYNTGAIRALRAAKMKRVHFRRPASSLASEGMPQHYLDRTVVEEFQIPEAPPVAENEYNLEIISQIRENPDALFLDVGAGLRHTCYSNVVTTEIWPSISTDIVCVGEDLPFSDAQFDFVLCLAVLEHTRRPWIAVQEILRVLKPGGMVRIDWPFLQPVHGYPHHYFNATPKGLVSQFEEACEIVSAEVRLWQHPIFALTWLLDEWRAGLPAEIQTELDGLSVADLLSRSAEQSLALPFCAALPDATQQIIACGTTLTARKRG